MVGYEAGFLEALEIKKIKKIKLEEKERMTYTIIKRVHIDVLDSPKTIVFGEPGGCHLLFICCCTNTNVHAQTRTNTHKLRYNYKYKKEYYKQENIILRRKNDMKNTRI